MGGEERRLRAAGIRVTRPRLAVLAVLERTRREGAHLLAAEVEERVAEILGRVSTQTVYDCLAVLVEGGLARRLDLPGGAARFEGDDGDGHHHAVCTGCGRILNVTAGAGHTEPPRACPPDFEIREAQVLYHGICARCRVSGPTR